MNTPMTMTTSMITTATTVMTVVVVAPSLWFFHVSISCAKETHIMAFHVNSNKRHEGDKHF